jgi:hypothetical protein
VNLIHGPRNQGKIVRNESLVHRWRPKGASMKIKMRDFQCSGSIVDVSTKIRAVINFLDITFENQIQDLDMPCSRFSLVYPINKSDKQGMYFMKVGFTWRLKLIFVQHNLKHRQK